MLFKFTSNKKTMASAILAMVLILLFYKSYRSINFRYAAYLAEKEKRIEAEEENKYWSGIDKSEELRANIDIKEATLENNGFCFRGANQGLYSGEIVRDKGIITKSFELSIDTNGCSSPVVVGRNIFFTSADEDADKIIFRLIKCNTVKLTTEKFLIQEKPKNDIANKHIKNSYASPTPIVTDKGIICYFGEYGLFLVNESGLLVWSKRDLYKNSEHGPGSSPIVIDDMVIVSIDSNDMQSTVAFDLWTGNEKWKCNRACGAVRPYSFSSPLCFSCFDKKYIATVGSGLFCLIDVKAGVILDHFKFDEGWSIIPQPVAFENKILFCTGWQNPRLICLEVSELGKLKQIWELNKNIPNTPTPIIYNKKICCLADNGVLSLIDLESGSIDSSLRIPGNFSSSLIMVGKNLITISEKGRIGVFEVDGSTLRKSGSFQINDLVLSTPSCSSTCMYVRSESKLFGFKISNIGN